MVRFRLPAKLRMEFGTRDGTLVTDPALEDDIRLAEHRSRSAYERRRAELDDIVAEYESLLDEAPAAAHEQALDRLEELEREYAAAKPHLDAEVAMLATVLVVRALRETGDGVPDPDTAEVPVRERLADAPLDDRRTDDYLRAVRAALDIDDPDPLAWVPEEELPDRMPPHDPDPAHDDPTWELPTPEPSDEDLDPVELMEEMDDGELDPDKLDGVDAALHDDDPS